MALHTAQPATVVDVDHRGGWTQIPVVKSYESEISSLVKKAQFLPT